jgi:hypothetical protein
MASSDEEQDRPECKTCGKSYGSNGDLNKHLKLQSQKSEEERGKHPAAGSKKFQKALRGPNAGYTWSKTAFEKKEKVKKNNKTYRKNNMEKLHDSISHHIELLK